MTKTRLVFALFVSTAAGLGLAWKTGWFGPSLSRDPQVAEVQRLQRAVDAAAPEKEQQAIEQMQAKARQLTPAQQIAVFADQQRELMEQEEARLEQFFAQSEADQVKELDEQIDRMQQARQRMLADPAVQPANKQPKEPPKPSGVTDKTFNDVTTPEYRALSQQYHRKLVGRMTERGFTQ